jgi:hypothetical protein
MIPNPIDVHCAEVGVKIKPGSLNVDFEIPSFICEIHSRSLYHNLFDVLGQWLYLKSIQKDLQFLIYTNEDTENFSFVDFLVKYCGAKRIEYSQEDESESYLAKCFFSFFRQNDVIKSSLSVGFSEKYKPLDTLSNNPKFDFYIISAFTELLIKFFDNLRDEFCPEIPHKKIFLADFSRAGGRDIGSRELNEIFKFFLDNDYEIIHQSDLNFVDQVRLVMSATDIASYTGSAASFSVCVKSQSNFILLNPWSGYRFPYTHMIRQNCNLRSYKATADTESLIKQLRKDQF